MAESRNGSASDRPGDASAGIDSITVAGYKSILEPVTVRIAPLTILAGPNSSGKSSALQPLLLLKQTLEAAYDPGALQLRGPNVRFASADQLLSHLSKRSHAGRLSVALTRLDGFYFRTDIEPSSSGDMDVAETEWGRKKDGSSSTLVTRNMSPEAIESLVPALLRRLISDAGIATRHSAKWRAVRRRCFLDPSLEYTSNAGLNSFSVSAFPNDISNPVTEMIHLPGLRGNPERTYPIVAVEHTFPGLFQTYTASIIAQWQDAGNSSVIEKIDEQMWHLGLTSRIHARRVGDTEVDLRVARLQSTGRTRDDDSVSIADVGLGVSQTLPVIVALLVAEPGQTVYIEQPEIHLHPSAQFKIADILVEAANRGVRVIVETHSSITLLGIQAAVAEGRIDGHDVTLHWFSRDRIGQTRIKSVEMGESGEFGDWPEDFSDVYLQAQGRYLDAVERRQLAD